MITKYFRYIITTMTIVLSSVYLYAQNLDSQKNSDHSSKTAQLKIAQTFEEDECSAFYNGLATVGDYFDDCYYINRRGENIGSAPGQLIFANKQNRVFKKYESGGYDHLFITDNSDNIISEKYNKIEEYNGYFFCEKYKSYKKKYIVDSNGKIIFTYGDDDNTGYYFTYGNSDFVKLTDPDCLFYKGKILFNDHGIQTFTFDDNWPLILSENLAYNKKTGKIIDHTSKLLGVMPFVDFYYILDKNGIINYFNYNDEPIEFSKLATSSKGVSINNTENGTYILYDKNKKIIPGTEFEAFDPFLWQSDYLAVKRNGKWGYVKGDGTQHISCNLDSAGPVIFGHSYITVTDSIYKSGLLNVEKRKYDFICNGLLDSYFFNKINEEILFCYKTKDGDLYSNRNGFFNLNGGGMRGIIDYPEFIDGISLSHYYVGKDFNYIAFDLKGKPLFRSTNGMRKLGKNLFYATVEEGTNYNEFIFNNFGEILADLSKSKLSISGPCILGLIPFTSPGGHIKVNGEDHASGYLYDTFSQSLDKTLAIYGDFGNSSNANNADKFLSERINLMDYYQILGNRALENGSYNLAISYFDKMIELYTVTPTAFFGKGIAYINLGDYDSALDCLDFSSEMPPGTEYAKAVCYFNLGKLNNAQRCCTNVGSDDPCYDEALQMRKDILNIKKNQSKQKLSGWDKAAMILGAISNGLQLFSQSMAPVQTPQNSYTPSPSYNYNSSNTSTRKTCSSCHGTGLSSAKERAAFYSYSDETYSNSPCEVCGDRDSHYHKPCPRCIGKGYTNF